MNESDIFNMYKKMNIRKNEICLKCQEENKNLFPPISIWQVGTKYENSKHKVLFVGKNARGRLDLNEKNNFIDSTQNGENYFFNCKKSAYWNYTREISEKLYGIGKASWDNISFTNIIKCNNSMTIDTTTDSMRENCINQFFLEELNILQPEHIVFYTNREYDKNIKEIFNNIENKTTQEFTVECGKRQMLWWEFDAKLNNKIIKCLRTNHPERKKKEPFVENVANWIRKD